MSGIRRRKGLQDDDGGFAGSDIAAKPARGMLPSSLKQMDIFPKLVTKERERTSEGGAVFAITVAIAVLLVLTEVARYISVETEHHVRVDPTVGQKLRIEFDVTFHALRCGQVNMDAMDVTGEQQEPEDHGVFKQRVGKNGKLIGERFAHLLPWERQQLDRLEEEKRIPEGYCGSCYGAQTPERKCCNTCEDVKTAYLEKGWNAAGVMSSAEQCKDAPSHGEDAGEEGEGCRLSGYMLVNKVAGNLNVAMGAIHVQESRHIHQFNPSDIPKYDVSHTVHRLRFGPALPGLQMAPLEGTTKAPKEKAGVYQYYLKVVPTVVLDAYAKPGQAAEESPDNKEETRLPGEAVRSNQYSVKTFYRPAVINGMRQNILPGVFFVYDLSPFMVQITTKSESLWQLVTGLCAIVGGVFTVSSLLDGVWYHVRNLATGVAASVASPSARL